MSKNLKSNNMHNIRQVILLVLTSTLWSCNSKIDQGEMKGLKDFYQESVRKGSKALREVRFHFVSNSSHCVRDETVAPLVVSGGTQVRFSGVGAAREHIHLPAHPHVTLHIWHAKTLCGFYIQQI